MFSYVLPAFSFCTVLITDSTGAEAVLWTCIRLSLRSSPSRDAVCPGFDISWLFLKLQANTGMLPRLSHDHFLPDTMRFIVRVLPYSGHLAVSDADWTAESTTGKNFCKS